MRLSINVFVMNEGAGTVKGAVAGNLVHHKHEHKAHDERQSYEEVRTQGFLRRGKKC